MCTMARVTPHITDAFNVDAITAVRLPAMSAVYLLMGSGLSA